MRIKKLSIQGFKSFADKVVLNLAAEPAAIIGPNGCGKSNIIDAIRWVTGEQNARHLRGKNMEDIISNGCESRKPLGMAEVILTFSNERGHAPARFASFSEIEVARRLYRSGESEYYINKVKCRLRDVADLFTDTGIGKQGYSIVEQGQVSWLINARPEERRVLFEEAAGINKFKHKRDTALRRLASTKDNLLRVSDIISEVKRQLNSLNRQAKKAERYRVAKDALKEVDLRLTAIEYGLLQDKRLENQKKIAEAEDLGAGLLAEGARLESGRDNSQSELSGLEERYRVVEERVYTLEKTLSEEERKAEVARIRSEELARNNARLQGEISETATKKDLAAKGLSETEDALEEAGLSMTERQKELDILSADLKAAEDELQGRREVEGGLKARLVEENARLSNIRFSIQTAIKDEAREREREAKTGAGIVNARQRIDSLTEPLAVLQQDITESTEKGESLETSIEELSRRLEGLEGRKQTLESKIEGGKESRAADNSRLNTLLEMERNLENIHGGARSILKEGKLRGVHGIIADYIDTNPGYEKAVEAALAEKLEYVIVEGQGETLDAISFLKTNAGGRGSFVPMRELRPAPSAVPAGYAAGSGVKAIGDEIKIRDGYSHIVNTLLGDTIIAQDLNEAIKIWSTEGLFKTIVTLEGERLSSDGVITGGGLEASDGGILQRRGEIKAIKKSLNLLETNLGELTEEMRGLEEEIISGRRELDEHKASLHRVEIKQVNTGSEIKRRENELQTLRELRQNLEKEQNTATEALLAISEKNKNLQREREALEESLAVNDKELLRLGNESSLIEEKKRTISTSVTAAKVELARVTERRGALEARRGDQQRLITELADLFLQRADEKARSEAEIEDKKQLSLTIKNKIESLYKELRTAKEGRTVEKEGLQAVTERIQESDGAIKAIEDKLRRLEEQKGTLGFGLKEIEMKVASLEEKMAERYGLSLDDLARPLGEEGAVDKEDGTIDEAADPAALREERDKIRAKILSMGEVSLSALEEYRELDERHTFLLKQHEDLTASMEGLHKAIARINRTTRAMFSAAFKEINEKFTENFPKLFRGGHAELRLLDETNILESGIEIVAQPPGKKLQNLTLLSGGEKALTAVSLIFSIFLIKPSPFCLLDEVDAPLDEANIDRFNAFVRDISNISQFILITHNKRTMEMVERLYGITMEEPGVSKVVSVKF